MDTPESIATTQMWLRRHAPPHVQALLIPEATELAHWSDEELAEARHELLDDYTIAVSGRSDLFPNLVTFEAWHRLTGYVLGQPMDDATARRTAWLWHYSATCTTPTTRGWWRSRRCWRR